MTGNETYLRELFLLTIEIRLFWLVTLVYCFSFIAGISYLIFQKRNHGRVLTLGIKIATSGHLAVLLFRAYEVQRFPFQSHYEALSWFAFLFSAVYLIVRRKWSDIHLPGTIVSGFTSVACLYGLIRQSPVIKQLLLQYHSPYFEFHVIFGFFAYSLLGISFSIELSRIIASRYSKKDFGVDGDALRGEIHRLVYYGFFFLTVSIVLGGIWANDIWGTYWSWDPKQTWSLITWLVYAMYLHAKSIKRWQGAPATSLNIIGYICVIFTFVGIPWLLSFFLTLKSCHGSHQML